MADRDEQLPSDAELKNYFPDLPKGPLDEYRKKSTFDWRRMKLAYDSIESIKMKDKVWRFMEGHPLFRHTEATPTLDEQRHMTLKRVQLFNNARLMSKDELAAHPRLFEAYTEAIFMFDNCVAIKLSVTILLFHNTIRNIGKEHHLPLIEASKKGKISGCFALTEIAHGSNAKGMRTTATYNVEERCFILHTPDFEAAKCWAGSLGKCATHAIVYAILISKGKNHGLHSFMVPIRDPRTLKPYAGVTVGDHGEKISMDGIDNGFVMFNKYRLEKEAALDKLGGVDENGDYKTPFSDTGKRFSAAIGSLSGGRIHITAIATTYLQKAVVIAVRYSAVRRQFGPENSSEETPVLEYQQQQSRLLPYLAATYAMRIFSNWFEEMYTKMSMDNAMDEQAASRGMEMHALSAATKPVCGWAARDGIQHCRECCGGHGYLKAAGIGDIRNDNEATMTYEGDNCILLQQASKWLLGVWSKRTKPGFADTPFGSIRFLKEAQTLLTETCKWNSAKEMVEPANLVHMYNWLTTFMLKLTADKISRLKTQGKNSYEAKNDSQSFNAVTLALVYGENFILSYFYETAKKIKDTACRAVLLKLVALYGAFLLEKHMATLYIGGFFTKGQGILLREGILCLCAELSTEVVTLADTLAPPDWCLNSVLGYSDGEAYKHIESSIMTYPGSMTRPEWWRDVVYWDSSTYSKL